ncbi:MAG: codA protein [Candidatus Parcubacteria bacterium]|jgi:cytosine/adenosine deaminase-related metal-dependent hydrolase
MQKKATKTEPWDLKSVLLHKIKERGGYINCHAHLDRAFTITLKKLDMANHLMERKWELVDEMKKKSSEEDYYHRIVQGLDLMVAQGVTATCSFIDIDPVSEFRAIKAAVRAKKEYAKKIDFRIINQTLKGVLDKKAREYIEKSLDYVDIIGGLPSKDRPYPDKHLDYLFGIARETGKMVHMHIDQENNPKERDTELLLQKVIEHNLQGKVVAVHAISLAAQPPAYRKMLLPLLKAAGITIVVCPSAAVNMKEVPFKSHVHKPIAPVVDLMQHGVNVALGVDNIMDIYEPFIDGDMWFETRLLMEVSRYYDLDKVADIATVNGKKALGIT